MEVQKNDIGPDGFSIFDATISISDIKNFLCSPRKYYYHKHGVEQKITKEKKFIASAICDIINTPEVFYSKHVTSPKFDKRSNVGKELYEKFVQENEHMTILSEQETEMIIEVSSFVKSYPELEFLFKNVNASDFSFEVKDETTNLTVLGEIDIVNIDQSAIVEIDVFFDPSFKILSKDEYLRNYALNAAFNIDFVGQENYYLIAIEKDAPYQTCVYKFPDLAIQRAREEYKMALNLIKWSYENEYWCDFTEFEILKDAYLDLTMDEVHEKLISASIIKLL